MNLTHFAEVLQEKLAHVRNVVILTHYNPDGDAIGSSLALYLMLKKLEKNVNCIVPNDFPKFLKWLPEAKNITIYEFKSRQAKQMMAEAEMVFCLDFNAPSRIEQLSKLLHQSNAFTVLIDHHQEPETFDLSYSDIRQPATCQMVYKVFQSLQLEEKIDMNIATCLYTGIITDTGNFKYRNTTSETHIIASKLMDYGLEIDIINAHIFDSSSPYRLQLLGTVLQRIEVSEERHASFLYVTQKELKQFHFQKGDTEGFVNYGLSIEGVKITVFLSEDLQHNFVKLSFRSIGKIDVNYLARTYFNGGGHLNAAGGKSEVSISETIQKIKEILDTDLLLKNQLAE